MTIRYQCDQCGSVLKIRDDKTGTTGHCPKCQSEFIVPAPDAADAEAAAADAEPAAVAEKPVREKVAAARKSAPPAASSDDEFDPAAFLMEGGDAPSKPPVQQAPADRAPPKPRPESPERPAAKQREQRPAKRTSPAEELDPNSAAASASAMLTGGTNASSNAKELLTRTMEESRVRAAQMPAEDEEPGVDYGAFFREVGLRGLLIIGGLVLAVGLAYWFGNYMAGGGIELPELARVRGMVSKGGAPLAEAQVTFTPIDVDTASSTAVTDENGEYDLYYIEGVRGAVVGRNRVEVSKIGSDGRPVVAPQTDYGFGSNMIHEVPPGGETINIEIP